MTDFSTARDIMTIEWKDPNMRLHGKRHKRDRYYFRWHYGKQRRVCIYKEYVDKPTEKQRSAREAFTELRREVARQLRDSVLREEWERRFAEDNEGYKFLHTYVYAMMKREAGTAETTETTGSVGKEQKFRSAEVQKYRKGCAAAETEATMSSMRRGNALVSTSTSQETHIKGVSVSTASHTIAKKETRYMASLQAAETPILFIYNGHLLPLFLPNVVPKIECLRVC